MKPIEQFEAVLNIAKPKKIIITIPRQGQTVDLLITEKYFVIYAHTKGSHWNMGGNHYKYYHDRITGEFLHADYSPSDKVIEKQRILKADAYRLNYIVYPEAKKAKQNGI